MVKKTDCRPIDCRDVVENVNEIREPQVRDFLAPEPLHPFQIQGFKDQDIMVLGQLMCQLEVIVPTTVDNVFVDSGQLTPGATIGFRAVVFA